MTVAIVAEFSVAAVFSVAVAIVTVAIAVVSVGGSAVAV